MLWVDMVSYGVMWFHVVSYGVMMFHVVSSLGFLELFPCFLAS